MKNLVHLPFDLPGKVYRSPMPFARFDEGGTAFSEYKEAGINTVVMLVDEGEDLRHAGLDLKGLYQSAGMDVIQFPIQDFNVPEDDRELGDTLKQVVSLAEEGKNVAVHCFAGRGRTGMFLALVARRVLGLGGEEAIAWTRQYFPAVETDAQARVVMNDKG
jgi:protein-tyrosine phosphatase